MVCTIAIYLCSEFRVAAQVFSITYAEFPFRDREMRTKIFGVEPEI